MRFFNKVEKCAEAQKEKHNQIETEFMMAKVHIV